MRVLILHSDVPEHAPPDEQDTLVTANAVARALAKRGHVSRCAAFSPSPQRLADYLRDAEAEVVFNLVESVFGQGELASLAPAMLDRLGFPNTGARAASMSVCGDKLLSKRLFRAGGLPTPEWAEPDRWEGLSGDCRYVVKSVTEDASLGLDDDAVVSGRSAVVKRAALCRSRYGGRWFAECYLDGREFNVALLEDNRGPRVLPIAEMRFEAWPERRPRIVGYAAKWDASSEACSKTVRGFGIEQTAPQLARSLRQLAQRTWHLFRLAGYARVDFRLDRAGEPMILEINPNPCLEPHAGFASAAAEAGIPYADLVERVLLAAHRP